MANKTPTISAVVETACINVKSKRGYDVNIAEGRAFLRAFFKIIIAMKPSVAIKFLAYCLKHYSKK